MRDEIIEMMSNISLRDKRDILNHLLWSDDTSLYLHSDKRGVGFDIEMNLDKMTRWACLNGLSLQINLSLDHAEACCWSQKKPAGKTKLNSFKVEG